MLELSELPLRYFLIYITAMTIGTAVHISMWAMLFGTLLLLLLWMNKRHQVSRQWNRLAVLCAALAISMNISYEAMAGAVPVIHGERFDAQLMQIDQWLIGETPSVYLSAYATSWLTDIMSFCYLFFMPLLFISLLRYFFASRHLLGEFYTGLFTVYGIGFLGYVLVPAQGPYLAWSQLFHHPLQGGFITAINRTMVIDGSNHVDVFPSLHTAVSGFILLFAWKHHRKEFWFLLLPVIGLWLSTFYLRYHYLVDVLAGFALALFAYWESHRYAKNLNKRLEHVTTL